MKKMEFIIGMAEIPVKKATVITPHMTVSFSTSQTLMYKGNSKCTVYAWRIVILEHHLGPPRLLYMILPDSAVRKIS